MSRSCIRKASDLRLFVEYYKSFVFYLPKTLYLAILTMVIISLFILTAPYNPMTYISLLMVLSHSAVLYIWHYKLLSLKRVLGFLVFASWSGALIRVLSMFVSLPTHSADVIMVLTSLNLLYTLFLGCGLNIRKLIILIVVSIYSLLVVSLISPLSTFLGVISILLLFIIFIYLNKFGVDILGAPATKVISSFIKLLWANEVEPLEEVLNGIGTDRSIDFRFLLFRDVLTDTPKVVLVIPGLHPGPFRAVGSSSISTMLIEEFEKYGVACIVLHSASSHELDATSSRQLREALKRIIEKVLSISQKSSISIPFRVEFEDLSSFNLSIDDTIYSMISRHTHGMDDISHYVQERVERELGSVVIIDSHNSYVDDHNPVVVPNSELYFNIVKMLRNVVYTSKRLKRYDKVMIGYSRLKVADADTYELDSGGIACVTLRFDDDLFSILSFDSNNILLPVRCKLRTRLMKEFNLRDLEITTTDTHSIVGIRAREEYSVLGRRFKIEELYKLSREVLSNSLDNMYECYVEEHIITCKLRVLGVEGLNKLRDYTSKSLVAIKPLVFVIFLLPLLSILIK